MMVETQPIPSSQKRILFFLETWKTKLAASKFMAMAAQAVSLTDSVTSIHKGIIKQTVNSKGQYPSSAAS